MNLSVVIPTYNRGERLANTLRAVLSSDTAGLNAIEVLVVDDGSSAPAISVVERCVTRPPFTLQCIRQENGGPAKARNTGFRAASHDLVLFMDDDILPPAQLLRQHVEAHRVKPNCVIFGWCYFAPTESPSPFLRYVDSLEHNPSWSGQEEFVASPTSMVASGHLSVEKRTFSEWEYVYREDMATIAAEELELSVRLAEHQIPLLVATRIVAIHDHDVSLKHMCRQAYGHAMGYAEAAIKCPGVRSLTICNNVLSRCSPIARSDGYSVMCKKLLKVPLSSKVVRSGLVTGLSKLDGFIHSELVLWPLYRLALGLHMVAGVRDGLRQFTT